MRLSNAFAQCNRRLMLGGEAFIDVSEDFATEYCESTQEKVQAELDECKAAMSKIEERQKVFAIRFLANRTLTRGRFL